MLVVWVVRMGLENKWGHMRTDNRKKNWFIRNRLSITDISKHCKHISFDSIVTNDKLYNNLMNRNNCDLSGIEWLSLKNISFILGFPSTNSISIWYGDLSQNCEILFNYPRIMN